jgi:hypothetical protein
MKYFWFIVQPLDILESLCHKVQRLFGFTHYFWLKIDAVICAAFFGGVIYPTVPPEERWKMIGVVAMMLLAATVGYSWWERKSYKRLAQGLRNPLRKKWMAIYLRWFGCYLHMAIFLAGILWELLSGNTRLALLMIAGTAGIFAYSMLYVLPACDPLPPSTSRVREWLNKTFLKPALS